MDIRPDSSIILPKTVYDFEQLLEHDIITNTPALPTLSADEIFYRDYDTWQTLSRITQRNAWIWNKDLYGGEVEIRDWNNPYQAIFYCNSVLDNIEVLDDIWESDRDRLKGWALFSRAYAFYNLATNFSNVYDPRTAETELGIPLKLNSNIDETVQRSSLQKTYDQIISDILDSSKLLKSEIPEHNRNRPTKTAAFALLARIYLSMGNYELAEAYVDKTLNLYNELLDYNSLDTIRSSAFTSYSALETIYFSREVSIYENWGAGTIYQVDSNVLSLYSSNDMRFPVFFTKNNIGNYRIKPINALSGRPFTGLAVDEMYLIKAECLARKGLKDESLGFLNDLVETRMKTGTFRPIIASTADEVLQLVLLERRKTLVWRGLRWQDLKRLNRDGFNITLSRDVDGMQYVLPPNDPRYVFPIPDDEISFSGIEQNNR